MQAAAGRAGGLYRRRFSSPCGTDEKKPLPKKEESRTGREVTRKRLLFAGPYISLFAPVKPDLFESMYTEYFGLKENPFSITPDPAYFYVSARHREALAHLMYAFNGEGGFVLLTGEVGTGKTTVCRRLLEQAPTSCDIAFILYPKLTGEELLAAICDEFAIDNPGDTASSRVLVARIYDYLVRTHEQGRRAVLILEEAQNLSDAVLEQVRLLTNLETNKQKLLQIIMLGQPELLQRLRQPELRQLSQRITARYHLAPLSYPEMKGYVSHRLAVAGLPHSHLFPSSTVKTLFRLTGGVPRLINVICDRALTGAYVQGKDRVSKRTLHAAALEVSDRKTLPLTFRKGMAVLLACFALACVTFVLAFYGRSLTHRLMSAPAKTESARPGVPAGPPAQTGDPARKETWAEAGGDKLDFPRDQTRLLTRERAFRTLLEKWQLGNLKTQSVSQVCHRAGSYGLACLEGKDSIDGLRRMNRPAVLRFSDDGKGDYYVSLMSLTLRVATIVAGDETRVLDIKELGRRWSGEYTLLWRLPPGYKEEIRQGDHGPLASWIAKQLATAEGRTVNPDSGQVYDDALTRQVKQFQISAGLVPDGLAGPKTLIRLSDIARTDEPSLDNRQGGR